MTTRLSIFPLSHLVLLAVFCPLLLLSGCGNDRHGNEESANEESAKVWTDQRPMPEFSDTYKKIARDYYKIIFTEDGYPARNNGDSLFEHPIYGAYVIGHYLGRYKRGEDSLLPYIKVVAEASARRMTEVDGALLMKYDKGVTRSEVSGLTQSRYLSQFSDLYRNLNDERYKTIAAQLFNSFLIPIEEGGFLNEFKYGVTMEEYPERPVSYVLNGWLTALNNLQVYAAASGNPVADSLFLANCRTLEKLLPLFDCPEQFNSYYQLMGYQYIKLELDKSIKTEIVEARVDWPRLESYPITNLGEGHRYEPHFFAKDVKKQDGKIYIEDNWFRMNILTSRLVPPAQTTVHLTLDSEEENTVQLSYGTGSQYPTLIMASITDWNESKTFKVKKGQSTIVIPLDNDSVQISYIPTKFSKKVGDTYYNAYHFIHINTLRKLYKATGIESFKVWADRWEEYTTHWPDYEPLQEPDISIEPIP